MAIKHVVTLGYGFADGVAFIPTLGFTPSQVVTVYGPLCVREAQGFIDGAVAGQGFVDGAVEGEAYCGHD